MTKCGVVLNIGLYRYCAAFLTCTAAVLLPSPHVQVPPRVLIGSCVSKLLLHPLVGMALILTCLHSGVLPADLDPAVPLVMMLVWATPTAVLVHALATMLQVRGGKWRAWGKLGGFTFAFAGRWGTTGSEGHGKDGEGLTFAFTGACGCRLPAELDPGVPLFMMPVWVTPTAVLGMHWPPCCRCAGEGEGIGGTIRSCCSLTAKTSKW